MGNCRVPICKFSFGQVSPWCEDQRVTSSLQNSNDYEWDQFQFKLKQFLKTDHSFSHK